MGGVAEFSPKLWRVLLQRHADGPKPVGVLLLCRTDPADGMELVYLGLSLPGRRQGLGAMLVQQALATAAEENRKRMTLAVDSRNAPAIRLYYRHGFQKAGAKIAFIRDLRPVPAISPPLV
jgi:ribosomal protein S18 acetylase RimI-like enzyme